MWRGWGELEGGRRRTFHGRVPDELVLVGRVVQLVEAVVGRVVERFREEGRRQVGVHFGLRGSRVLLPSGGERESRNELVEPEVERRRRLRESPRVGEGRRENTR